MIVSFSNLITEPYLTTKTVIPAMTSMVTNHQPEFCFGCTSARPNKCAGQTANFRSDGDTKPKSLQLSVIQEVCISATPVLTTKEWQRLLTPNFRSNIIFECVQSTFPELGSTLHFHNKILNLTADAKFIEGDCFTKASSIRDYYFILNKKFDQIKSEIQVANKTVKREWANKRQVTRGNDLGKKSRQKYTECSNHCSRKAKLSLCHCPQIVTNGDLEENVITTKQKTSFYENMDVNILRIHTLCEKRYFEVTNSHILPSLGEFGYKVTMNTIQNDFMTSLELISRQEDEGFYSMLEIKSEPTEDTDAIHTEHEVKTEPADTLSSIKMEPRVE
jgi:hypothetical protein